MSRDHEGAAAVTDEGTYRAPRRLYLTRDKERVVEEGDPEAGFLLAAKGGEVLEADVERYGLRDRPDPEAKHVAGPPEDKAKPAPRRRKATE